MYTYKEIDLVFRNCKTKEDCTRARRTFTAVAETLPGKKIFYIRKKQRVRENQLTIKSN